MHANGVWNPTRLLAIKRESSCGEDSIRLLDQLSGTEPMKYAALSHCWGGNVPLVLTTSLLTEFKERISTSSLPTTFLHAVEATRRLGLDYLWIDSLCIIQDSSKDWENESSLMSKVYSGCYVNLAATHAEDSSGGLFVERDPESIVQLRLDLNLKGCEPGVYYGLSDSQAGFSVHRESDSALARRAWVFQERLHAPRTLHFGPEQIVFECCVTRASEGCPSGLDWLDTYQTFKQRFCHFRLPKSLAGQWQLGTFWKDVIEHYTSLKITKESDVLVALSGLASEMSSVAGPDDLYAAGMWRSDLPMSLMWHPIGSVSKPDTFLAPSWSWASLRCESIRLPETSFVSSQDLQWPLLKVLDITVVPTKIPFGPVSGGYIRVRGALAEAKTYSERRGHGKEIWCSFDTGKVLYCSIKDRDEDENQPITIPEGQHGKGTSSDGSIYLLIVAGEWYAHTPNRSGLLVTPTGVEKGQFRRVGTWGQSGVEDNYFNSCVLDPSVYEELTGGLATITIV
jgi:hypothetical protein